MADFLFIAGTAVVIAAVVAMVDLVVIVVVNGVSHAKPFIIGSLLSVCHVRIKGHSRHHRLFYSDQRKDSSVAAALFCRGSLLVLLAVPSSL